MCPRSLEPQAVPCPALKEVEALYLYLLQEVPASDEPLTEPRLVERHHMELESGPMAPYMPGAVSVEFILSQSSSFLPCTELRQIGCRMWFHGLSKPWRDSRLSRFLSKCVLRGEATCPSLQGENGPTSSPGGGHK